MAGTTEKPKADAEKEVKEEAKPEEVKKPLTVQQGAPHRMRLRTQSS